MFSYAKRRFWYWRAVHYLSIVRFRRRVVFGFVLLGVLIAWIITATTKPVFASRAMIRVDEMDARGFVPNDLSPEEMQHLIKKGLIKGGY